jgi:hypothetical protein
MCVCVCVFAWVNFILLVCLWVDCVYDCVFCGYNNNIFTCVRMLACVAFSSFFSFFFLSLSLSFSISLGRVDVLFRCVVDHDGEVRVRAQVFVDQWIKISTAHHRPLAKLLCGTVVHARTSISKRDLLQQLLKLIQLTTTQQVGYLPVGLRCAVPRALVARKSVYCPASACRLSCVHFFRLSLLCACVCVCVCVLVLVCVCVWTHV